MHNNSWLGVNNKPPFQPEFDYYMLILCFANCVVHVLYFNYYVFFSMLLFEIKLLIRREVPQSGVVNYHMRKLVFESFKLFHKYHIGLCQQRLSSLGYMTGQLVGGNGGHPRMNGLCASITA